MGSQDGALSQEVLDEQVNEYLLFHGTSKAAADAIVDEGFRIGTSGADRFGKGAYLAEDITKSLAYAGSGGIRYVLVCRAVCGDFYYTEADWEKSATDTGRGQGKDATLANPGRASRKP